MKDITLNVKCWFLSVTSHDQPASVARTWLASTKPSFITRVILFFSRIHFVYNPHICPKSSFVVMHSIIITLSLKRQPQHHRSTPHMSLHHGSFVFVNQQPRREQRGLRSISWFILIVLLGKEVQSTDWLRDCADLKRRAPPPPPLIKSDSFIFQARVVRGWTSSHLRGGWESEFTLSSRWGVVSANLT